MNPKLAEFAKASPHPTLPPDPVPVLRAEVAASRAKLQRIREAVAAKEQKLNRLLAESAMRGSATARTPTWMTKKSTEASSNFRCNC